MVSPRCPRCGSSQTNFCVGTRKTTNKSNVIVDALRGTKCHKCGYIKKKEPAKTHLKPWKDPESMFCDTDFLKRFINKDPVPGKECKDI